MGYDADATDDHLGVRRSLTGRRWRARPADPDTIRAHQARLGLSEPLARAMASRGVPAEGGEAFLRPTLRALFPDPSTFADMDSAARILVDAFEANRPTVVFADYDVDGASSAAQLIRWFRHMGGELPLYVPDRLTEGYGPSPAAFRKLREGGAELVITVDCGAAAHDALAAAREIGLEVVVIDHHLMREPPPCAALVNPNRADCGSGQGVLAAAGVTFVLLAALNREARRRGLFAARAEPDLRRWLDLAALGAICDVTQLTGFNRALASLGLRVLSEWRNPGLAALMDVAGLTRGVAGVFEAGFILGPRINAGGRVGRSDLGARLLSTDNPAEAAELAASLEALNAERKAIEHAIAEEAAVVLERDSNLDPDAPVLVVAQEGWHPGVIGIVASRLRERYRKPVIVAGIDRAADIAKGSGRSQPGVNLGRAIQAAFAEGLLLTGGGHAMAAGLTLRPAALPELREFLCERLRAEAATAALEDALDIDALVSAGGAARAILDEFAALAPFGPGNPEPLFALADVRVERPFPVKGGHLRCDLVGPGGGRLKAIAWRAGDTPLGRRLAAGGASVHVAGKLKADDWNGREGVQLEVEDVADPRRAV
ncbi:MAG TPA: single-stranded-DNA-specific exonuclease RecJ [Caulobacteraceae bacterium]|nr:single-stranded-DNA-specific exonuclease RecJ [Caulobacteraceae bacterium]